MTQPFALDCSVWDRIARSELDRQRVIMPTCPKSRLDRKMRSQSRFRKFEQRDEWKDCSSASH
jgi:hypothetical protein